MHRFGLFIVLLALVIGTTGQAADVPTGMGFVAHIDQAVSEGRLSSEDGLLYKFYYGFDQDRLPAAYRPELFVPLKNGTAIVREYQSRRDELPRRMRETIDPYLAHADPSEGRAKATYDSPSGRFRLTYETSGTHTVPTTDVDPANGIPDFVEKIATYLDNCWFVEITENDFAPPPNSPYPVTFENMQLYGYTQGLGGLATEIVLHHTYLNFPPNDDPEGNRWGAAKVTCAHEFKHASQGAQTAFPIPGWAELDAVWCEELVYDYVNDYFNYLTGESPIYQPAIPLDNGGLGSYEDCVWQIWMAETHGNEIITDLWKWRHDHVSQDMMDSYAQVLTDYGSSVAEAWGDFTAWNYAVGYRSMVGLGYPDGADYPVGGTVASFSTYPDSHSGTIDHLAANFIRCTGFGSEAGTVDVTFNGNNNALLTLTAVIEKTDGTGVIEPIALDAGNDATVSLSVPMEEISEVGLTIGNYHRVSDAGDYTISIDKGVWVPEPSLAVSVSSVAQVMETDTTGDLVVQLSNDGELGSSLDFSASVLPFAPAKVAVQDDGKSISGSTITCATNTYTPGATVDLVFTVYNGSSDDEWLNGASLEFLAGMTVNASTSFVGGSGGDLDSDGTGGDGATVRWYGDTGSPDYYGVIENGESATATVNVTFATDLVGTQAIAYTVDGDQWGGAPHTVFGNLRMGSAGPSVVVTAPNGGESFAVGDDLTITWAAGLLSDVKIDLSRDGGDTWENLVTETQNDGSYIWTTAGAPSVDCLIRVSSLDDSVSDVGDAAFTLYEPVTWLSVSPPSGIIAQGGSEAVTLHFDAAGLAAGDYTAYVVVTHNGATSPDAIPVDLAVTDPSPAGETPLVFGLRGAYPNPFNPRTHIAFTLGEAGPVALQVLDLRGRVVKTVVRSELAAGEHDVVWDGTDDSGRHVAAGTYLARLQTRTQSATSKMVLAK